MSTIMYRKTVSIAESASDMGVLFVESPMDIQKAFLLAASHAAKDFSWPMQCRSIVNEMDSCERNQVALWLGTLLEHLTEPMEAHTEGHAAAEATT